MKMIRLKILFLFVCIFASQIFAQSDKPFSIDESPLPSPTSPVMDFAGVIDSATKKRLEEKIIEFRDSSNPSVELAVAVVDTTGNRPIFDYSLAVARGWGIGSRQDDNPGALLFIAIDDRKYFTQVSRNLEDELTDGIVGAIQRNYLVPEFKNGNYAKGIEDTIDQYIRTIKNRQEGISDTTDDLERNTDYSPVTNDFNYEDCFPCLIVLGIIIFIIIANSSGGGGGGGGRRRRKSSGSDVAGDILSAIVTGIIVGGSSGGSSSSDWSSGGSSWGGGSSGGWGGFGGGGDFGGGGAGGGW